MIIKKEIEKERSPRGLRKFVTLRKSKIKKDKEERHKAIQKKGIYKVFVDEIIPLSLFCLKKYPNNYKILPVLGNQGYDAIVKNENGVIIEKIELTSPHPGKAEAEDAKLIVKRGYGKIKVYDQGGDLKDLFSIIKVVCRKKAIKDYSDCSLVISIDFIPPFPKDNKLYSKILNELKKELKGIKFIAKKIYLLVLPLNKYIKIYG